MSPWKVYLLPLPSSIYSDTKEKKNTIRRLPSCWWWLIMANSCMRMILIFMMTILNLNDSIGHTWTVRHDQSSSEFLPHLPGSQEHGARNWWRKSTMGNGNEMKRRQIEPTWRKTKPWRGLEEATRWWRTAWRSLERFRAWSWKGISGGEPVEEGMVLAIELSSRLVEGYIFGDSIS